MYSNSAIYEYTFSEYPLLLILFTIRPHTGNKYESFIPTELVILMLDFNVSISKVFMCIYHSYTKHRIACERETTTLMLNRITKHAWRKQVFILCLCMFPFFFGNIIGNSTIASEMAQSVPFRHIGLRQYFYFQYKKNIQSEAELIKYISNKHCRARATDLKYSVTKCAQS